MHTRPDIYYTMNALSQFMSDMKHILLVAAKHVLIYVWGTIIYGLWSHCVAELGGWVPWRREASKPDQGFVRCPTWREGIFVLFFKINKHVMSFFFPNNCSMCDWISFFDHMMMLIRLVFHFSLIIIALYVVILVWGRYNSFCRSLGARGARRGLKGCLDQPSFG